MKSNMAKLVMMKGLPASGKTTKAKELMEQGGNFVRINRDLLREMLHFNKWCGNNEDITVKSAEILASMLLQRDVSIIIDDTNLGDKHRKKWYQIAHHNRAKFEVVEMDTKLETCLERNAQRDNPVPQHILFQMAMEYGYFQTEGLIVVDMDGTLADCEHRQHHVQKKPKDWKSFFAEMEGDELREEVAEDVQDLYEKGYTVILVSARPEDYREVTEQWLIDELHGMTFHTTLLMRRKNDTRPDTEVKEEIYNKYLKHYKIVKVFDDRPSVIRMWRSHGLDIVDVGKGIEF